MPDPTCSVLVVSCDLYSDLWQPFFSQFWRYWPDCPFGVYLGTNQKPYRSARVRVIQAGEDRSWSSNLRFFLNQTDSTYVLLLLEDFFLSKPVATCEILRHVGALDALQGTMLRLMPNPPPNSRINGYSSFGVIHASAPYRVSAQAAIWNRTRLLELLDDRENPWEFESNATIRSRLHTDGFFCTYQPVLPYRHVIERGAWFWSAARFYKKQDIGCDFEARPVMTPGTALRKYINGRCRYWRDRILAVRFAVEQRRDQGSRAGRGPAPQLDFSPSPPLKIAFLTNVIPPYHKPFLDCLAKRHEMRVLLSAPMEPNRTWKLEWDGLDVVTQKTLTLSGRWRHPRGFTEPLFLHVPIDTVAQLRRFDPDITISAEMGARTLFAALYRKLRRRSKLIVWAEIAESTEQARGWMRDRVRRFLHKNVDAFLVTGASGARYLRGLGVSEAKIFQISYTTEVSKFAAAPRSRKPGCEQRLLYVGQLIERKGLVQFLDVLSKWARANPDRSLEFVLAGDGPLRNHLEWLPKPSNLEVSFAGAIQYEDLPRIYAEAGIFVLPSLADTWGVVVNEAMAAGLPVLGSMYAQAVSEMVRDGENGWVFRADDPGEMYDTTDRALNASPEQLHRMRQCARTSASQLTPDYLACAVENAVNACMAMGAR